MRHAIRWFKCKLKPPNNVNQNVSQILKQICQAKLNHNKKALLHECKRYTTHRIAGAHYAALSNGGRYPSSHDGGGGYPIQSWWGVPHPDLARGTPSSHGGTPSRPGRRGYPGNPPIGNKISFKVATFYSRDEIPCVSQVFPVSQIFTAQVQSVREGVVFTGVFLFTFWRGVLHPKSRWGVPHPADGGIPSQVQVGVLHPADRGVPHPRSRGEPCPVDGGYPTQLMGVSHPRWGYPIQLTGGTPSQVQVGEPHPSLGVQGSISSTCYVAGSMPLAFTQDFLVPLCFPHKTQHLVLVDKGFTRPVLLLYL